MKKFFFGWLILVYSTQVDAQNQLIIPDTVSGPSINLDLAASAINFYPGVTTPTLGFNGDYLGPTIFLNSGQQVMLNVTNNCGDTTTVHWHGLHVPAMADGGPHIIIPNGTTWSPSFIVLDKASTFWYHPHLHMHTAEQVTKGAAGFIIVRDTIEAALDLPRAYAVDDIPLAIQTRAFDATGSFVVMSAMDTAILVNGTLNAFTELPAQINRLRILNASTERVYNFGFSNNQTFYQIGSDGGLLAAPLPLTRMQLAPGERAEVLVDLNGMTGQSIFLKSFASQLPSGIYGALNPAIGGPNVIVNYTLNPLNGADFNILQINVGVALGSGTFSIPATLVSQTTIPASSSNFTRTFQLSPQVMGPTGTLIGPFVINGQSFNMNVINETVVLGNTEKWEITNQTRIAHPFHIHDVQFYVLDINGLAPPANLAGRKDVILVPGGGGIVRFITQFEDYADPNMPYMYHCHMLSHEDEGMMGQFVVVDSTTALPELEANNFQIYPNPSNDGQFEIYIGTYETVKINWELTDLTGRVTDGGSTSTDSKGSFSINANAGNGVYLLSFKMPSGGRSVYKVMISR